MVLCTTNNTQIQQKVYILFAMGESNSQAESTRRGSFGRMYRMDEIYSISSELGNFVGINSA